MPRTKRVIAWSAAILLAAAATAAAAGFFSSIEDLPMPRGFAEVESESVVFESPGGRIVTAVARGTATVAAVRDFYRRALPPLGWRALPGDRFVREGEELRLSFDRAGGETVLTVQLVPGGR
jgi:hypothetical protein